MNPNGSSGSGASGSGSGGSGSGAVRRGWRGDGGAEDEGKPSGSSGRQPVALSDSLGAVVRSLRNDQSGAAGAGSAAAIGGVFGRWEDAVGSAVAAHVQPVKLDGRTLVVEVDEPGWATQLRFLEGTLRAKLLEVAGAVVDKVEVRIKRR